MYCTTKHKKHYEKLFCIQEFISLGRNILEWNQSIFHFWCIYRATTKGQEWRLLCKVSDKEEQHHYHQLRQSRYHYSIYYHKILCGTQKSRWNTMPSWLSRSFTIFFCKRSHHSLFFGSSQSLLIRDISGLLWTSQLGELHSFLFSFSLLLSIKNAAFTISLKTQPMRSWLLVDWLLASLAELSFSFVWSMLSPCRSESLTFTQWPSLKRFSCQGWMQTCTQPDCKHKNADITMFVMMWIYDSFEDQPKWEWKMYACTCSGTIASGNVNYLYADIIVLRWCCKKHLLFVTSNCAYCR